MKQAKAPRTLTLVERKAFRDAYRGKVLLDAANERWPLSVSPEKLDMGKPRGPCGCVLAQWVYRDDGDDNCPDYWDGLREVGLSANGLESMREQAHHGFNDGNIRIYAVGPVHNRKHQTTFTHLQRAWTYILRLLGR